MVIKSDILNKFALQKSTFSALIFKENQPALSMELGKKKASIGWVHLLEGEDLPLENISSNLSQLSLCFFE